MATRNRKNGSKLEAEASAEVAANEPKELAEQVVEEVRPRTNATKAKAAPRSKPVEPVLEDEPVEAPAAEVSVAPKTFLIPYVLLMLRDSLLHGYAIWEKLMVMGIPGLDENDRATIYRTLRQLEREGKIKSQWDTASDGPARRVYTLTGAGEDFLQIWAIGLNQYRQSLDFFFKMYTGGKLPSPFGFNFTNPVKGNNSKEGDK